MADALDSFLTAPLTGAQRPPLRALWHLAHGNWDAAHEAAQSGHDADAAWVHAMLHRQEGDHGNAAYWYRRAGRPMFRGEIADEQRLMLAALLEHKDD